MNDAVVLANRDAIIIGFNKAAEELFGWKRNEITGKSVKVLMPHSMAAKHDHYIEKYHLTKERRLIGVRRVLDAMHKNGNIFQGKQASFAASNIWTQPFSLLSSTILQWKFRWVS